MIERRFVDLDAQVPGITLLTRADDANWTAIVRLERTEWFHWNGRVRQDILVLEGTVRDETGSLSCAGDFLSRCDEGG